MNAVLRTRGLNKRYGRRPSVRRFRLHAGRHCRCAPSPYRASDGGDPRALRRGCWVPAAMGPHPSISGDPRHSAAGHVRRLRAHHQQQPHDGDWRQLHSGRVAGIRREHQPHRRGLHGPTNPHCGEGTTPRDCMDWIDSLHLRQAITYHSAEHFWPLQWIEGGLFLTVAILLAAVCFWWTRHRLSFAACPSRPVLSGLTTCPAAPAAGGPASIS
jgi:hypothetical protein